MLSSAPILVICALASSAEADLSRASTLGSWMNTLSSYVPWGTNADFLERARRMNEAQAVAIQEAQTFTLAESEFSTVQSEDLAASEESPSTGWYAYFTNWGTSSDEKAAPEEEKESYGSSVYNYMMNKVNSELIDATEDVEETKQTNFRQKVRTWQIVLVACAAAIIIGAAILLIYGKVKSKQKRKEEKSRFYTRV